MRNFLMSLLIVLIVKNINSQPYSAYIISPVYNLSWQLPKDWYWELDSSKITNDNIKLNSNNSYIAVGQLSIFKTSTTAIEISDQYINAASNDAQFTLIENKLQTTINGISALKSSFTWYEPTSSITCRAVLWAFENNSTVYRLVLITSNTDWISNITYYTSNLTKIKFETILTEELPVNNRTAKYSCYISSEKYGFKWNLDTKWWFGASGSDANYDFVSQGYYDVNKYRVLFTMWNQKDNNTIPVTLARNDSSHYTPKNNFQSNGLVKPTTIFNVSGYHNSFSYSNSTNNIERRDIWYFCKNRLSFTFELFSFSSDWQINNSFYATKMDVANFLFNKDTMNLVIKSPNIQKVNSDSVAFTFSILNEGNISVPPGVYAEIRIGDSTYITYDPAQVELPPGYFFGPITFTAAIHPKQSEYLCRIVVDPNNNYKEQDETDNEYQKTIVFDYTGIKPSVNKKSMQFSNDMFTLLGKKPKPNNGKYTCNGVYINRNSKKSNVIVKLRK